MKIVSLAQKCSRSAEVQVMHVKNGDKVQVMAGRERGRTGTVKRIDKKRGRVTVDGLNIVKRHQRAGAQILRVESSRRKPSSMHRT